MIGSSCTKITCPKKINGREKIYLYLSNYAICIRVLVADRPVGPWTFPLLRPLKSRLTPNFNVEWFFKPALLVESDITI